MKFAKRFQRATKILAVGAMSLICTFAAVGCSLFPDSQSGSSGQDGEKPVYTQSSLLKDVYKDYFPIGTIMSSSTINRYEDLFPHFNSVTAEYEMKWGQLEKKQGVCDYTKSDALIAWAKENGKQVRGHTLLWYKSLPTWVAGAATDKETTLALIDRHVKETVKYFGDSVYVWDVVNEALRNSVTDAQLKNDDYMRQGVSGSGTCDWYGICGMDFIKQAFRSADEARQELGLGEKLELFYNDYSLNSPNKREACLKLVKELQKEGIAIDGVGMQAHYRLPSYTKDKAGFLTNFEDSIKAFTALGIDVQITELDIRVYASSSEPTVYDGLPLELEIEQGELYGKIFEICRKYATPWKNGAGKVTGVTTWGVADDRSAQSSADQKEYPLIFSDGYDKKRAYYEIINF